MERNKKRIGAIAAAAVTALALAAGAGAQAQLQAPRGYQGPAGAVQQQVRAGAAVGESRTLGSLPFTGLDLALGVGAGLLLLLTGGAVRRLATKRA